MASVSIVKDGRSGVHRGDVGRPASAWPVLAMVLTLCLAGALLAGPWPAYAASSPEGEIAFVRDDQIWLMNADGSDQRMLVRSPGEDTCGLSWSPDGSRLAFCCREQAAGETIDSIYTVAADGTQLENLSGLPTGPVSYYGGLVDAAWSPGGGSIAFCYYLYGANVWDVKGAGILDLQQGRAMMLPATGSMESICWHPSGDYVTIATRLMGGAYDAGYRFWDVFNVSTRQEEAPRLTYPGLPASAEIFSPGWSPGGDLLACWIRRDHPSEGASESRPIHELVLLDATGRRVSTLEVVRGGSTTFESPSFSPDGAWLAVTHVRYDEDARETWIHPLDSGDGRRVARDASAACWRPYVEADTVVVGGRSSFYGADYGLQHDGESPDIDTRAEARECAATLRRRGFSVDALLNESAAAAAARVRGDSVFFFTGHGNWDIISFEEPNDGRTSALMTSPARNYLGIDSYVPLGYPDLSGLAVAVFGSCLAGSRLEEDGNIMSTFVDQGCLCAVGFSSETGGDSASLWSTAMFRYACDEALEVEHAARKAVKDARVTSLFGLISRTGGITESTLVVKKAHPDTRVYIDDWPPEALTIPDF